MTKKDRLKQSIIRTLHIFPIQRKSIFCHNFYGNGYDENPKYIADKLRKKGFKIYWALSRPNANLPLPDNVERVIVGTPKYFYAIATSKIWIRPIKKARLLIKSSDLEQRRPLRRLWILVLKFVFFSQEAQAAE